MHDNLYHRAAHINSKLRCLVSPVSIVLSPFPLFTNEDDFKKMIKTSDFGFSNRLIYCFFH